MADTAHMRAALALARRGLGNVWPNPAVGCVLVAPAGEAGGRVVGRGWTQPGGRPHAETEALARAGADARGATAYVTLEPCSHHGKTPPCSDALIEAGIARAVIALEDPDPRVMGKLHCYDDAIANLEKAIALEPNNADVNAFYGQVLNWLGNPEKGLQLIERAFSLETFAPPVWEFQLGHSYFLLHQYDEALARFNRAIERAPKFTPAYLFLAWAYVELDRLDDAKKTVKTALEVTPQFTVKGGAKIFPYRADEDLNRLLDSLRKAGVPEG